MPPRPLDIAIFGAGPAGLALGRALARRGLSVIIADPEAEREWPIDFRSRVAAFEQSLIEDALAASQFRQTVAAENLGLTYHQLRGLLKKYGLPK